MRLEDGIRILQALRAAGPLTVAQVAERTAIGWRTVYRVLAELERLGAPLTQGRAELEGAGMPPTTYAITATGLRAWLG